MIQYKKILRILPYLLLLFSIFVFQKKVITSFQSPLFGLLDTETWEYNGYYVKENISFTPFPQINFKNDDTLYPYGSNSVFQAWGLERDYFFAASLSLFGVGPWLQMYYLFSISASLILSFLILKKDFGRWKSLLAAFILTYFNFYPMYKYPFHVCYATFHWVAIGMLVDFLIYRKYILENKIEVNQVLLRVLLLVLSFGHDLGTITGFSLFSFSITFGALLIKIGFEFRQQNSFDLRSKFIFNKKYITISTILLTFLFAYLYFPVLFQIFINTKEVVTASESISNEWYWWANPLRIFMPYIPVFKQGVNLFTDFFGDHPEGQGSGSIGLFVLILGLLGLFYSKEKRIIFLPAVLLFLFYISYNPEHFPLIKSLPWFKYLRVASRVTINYAILFAIFSLGIDYSKFDTKFKKIALVLLILFGLFELKTAYSARANVQYKLDNSFFEYMDIVKRSPGVAVLDWPFCISAGNMDSEFCPFPFQTSYSYALRRFHHKKVIGQFFGRMFSVNYLPFKEAGWGQIRVFQYDIHNAILQTSKNYKCFSEDEWKYFDEFYRKNDFSGIQLHESVIPKECLADFYSRYGNPVANTNIPTTGKISFIPRRN